MAVIHPISCWRVCGTLLHSAATGGLIELVDKLTQMKFDVNPKNRDALIPIFLAAIEGHVAVVIELIKPSGDISLIAPDGKKAADYGADFGNQEIVQLFSHQGVEPHTNKFTSLIGEYFGQDLLKINARTFFSGHHLDYSLWPLRS